MKTNLKTLMTFAAGFAVFGSLAQPASAQAAPFAGLNGAWAGSGTVSLSDGSSERLRCQATYQVSADGNALRQTLRCASDSYKIELGSQVASEGGRVTGSWSETSRGISGSLQGRAGGGRIDVVVDSPAFSARLVLTTNGNRQSISINSASEIRNVTIAMSKR